VDEKKRPLSVTIIACIFLLVGAATFVFHFHELLPLQQDALVVEFTELLAIVAGAFMLRGHNWARWLALAWMAFHVAISFVDPIKKLAMHALIFALIAWVLLRPSANQYFRRSEVPSTR
jgi:hypothetical protein